MIKSIIAFILSLLTLVSSFEAGIQTDESNHQQSPKTEYSVEGTNAIGDMLATAIESSGNENSYADATITGVSFNDNKAEATYDSDKDGVIVVGIFDEDNQELYDTFTSRINKGKSVVNVEMDEDLPENYVLKATLFDDAYNQISDTYVSFDNTDSIKELEKSSIEDYESDLLINLDENEDCNFAVLDESVINISTDNCSDVIIQDNDNSIIEFEDADNTIRSLKPGDVFCYNKNNVDELLLNKVESVKYDGDDTVVIVSDAGLSEAFSVVDIEYYDPTCYAKVEEAQADSERAMTRGAKDGDIGDTQLTLSPSFKISSDKFSATVSFSIGTKVKCKWVKKTSTFNCAFTIEEKFSVNGSITGKISTKENKLATVTVPLPVAGLAVKIVFKWKAEASVALKVSFSVSQTIGANITYHKKFSYNSLSKRPSLSCNLAIEGKACIKIIAYPALSFLGCCDVGLKGYAGIQLTGKKENNWATSVSEKHACKHCVSLDLSLVYGVELELGIDVLFWSKYTSFTIVGEQTIPLTRGYWSITYGDIGWGKCPHKSYYTTFKIVDENGNTIKNAKVDGHATSNGIYKKWAEDGEIEIEATAPGYESLCICYGVGSVETITVKMRKGDPATRRKIIDPSLYEHRANMASRRNWGYGGGYGGYSLPPLPFTEPLTGVVLSTAVSGQRRSDTAWVQRELKKLGYYNSEPDGYYGYYTADAVRRFQSDYDLPVTGKVNRNVVEVIKKPLKRVAPPKLRLTSAANITNGDVVTVAWDAVTGASEYNVYVYNSNGVMVANAIGTKATNAAFILYEKGSYTIKAESKNDRFTSEMATLGTVITVTDPLIITFENSDGTILCKQYVAYGAAAIAPAAPEMEGYTFSKWDTDFSKVTQDGLVVKPIFTKNQYTVKFLNTDGKEIITENNKYYFGDNAVAPDVSAVIVPNGYKFIGWDKSFDNIHENITVRPVIAWENDDIPIVIDECSATKDEDCGYNVTVKLHNYEKKRTNGRIVVALKTEDEKFVTMTESSAFTLKKSDANNNFISTEELEIFVPSKESVSYVDVFVVDTYDDLIPISDMYRLNLQETSSEPDEKEQFSCFVDPSLAGKKAILFIYKAGDASDFTNEFIAQTTIYENGTCLFDFDESCLRETPSMDTGDFYVVLGIEGSEKFIYLDKIVAPKPVHTVTFKDYDGSIIKTEQVVQGGHATIPEENPNREGFTFAGWDYTNSSIYEDITITAIYVRKNYTVVFIDWTNKRFDVQTYYFGEPLRTPDLSTLEDYNTIGWEGAVEGTPVTQNMVITAKYEKKVFTVNFYDYNGKIIDSQLVEYGESASAPEIETDSYNFYGWNVDSLECITCSMDVVPNFSYAQNTAMPSANVLSGTYADSINVKLNCEDLNADIYYSINGSDFILYTSPICVSETATIEYYASAFGKNTSESVCNYYIINRVDSENEWKIPVNIYKDDELIGTYLVAYGSKISDNSLYEEEYGYEFVGFCLDNDLNNVLSDDYTISSATNLYVKCEPKHFTVVFKDNFGQIIDTQSVEYMQSAEEPDFIIEENDLIFTGWDKIDYLCVTEDVEINAVVVNRKDYVDIVLNRESYTMMEGYMYDLSATVTGNSNAEIIWESSDESVATVDENGKVIAIADGVAVITASLLGTDISKYCFITIIKNPEMSLTLKDNSSYIFYDDSICGVSPSDNSVGTIKTQIAASNIEVYDGSNELSDGDMVKTGSEIKMYDADGREIDSAFIIVVGDVDGDGVACLQDASHISKYLVNKEELDDLALLAADVNGDGTVNSIDASMIMRYQVNKVNL